MSIPFLVVRAGTAALLLVLPMSLAAQTGPRLGQERVGLRRPATVEAMGRARPDLRLPPRTQWVKGGVIGGVAGALLGVLVVSVAEGLSDGDVSGSGRLRGAAAGAGLGFLIGALIGGQFEKN